MRIAVLGSGSIGRRHLRNLAALGERDLIVHDPVASSLEGAARETGARACATLDDVWALRPDAALVTAPHDAHVALALEAARHGCHLFIEKPLSHTLDGVAELEEEARTRGLVTMVGCNMRFHPGPAEVKRLLDAGAIGEPVTGRVYAGSYLPSWRPGTDYRSGYGASAARGGGAILDFIHEIDLALWYFGAGEAIAAATVPARSIGLEVEGVAEMLLRHESGVLSSIHVNFVQRDYRRGCEIVGTQGSIYWDFERSRVRWCDASGTFTEREQPKDWVLNGMYVDEIQHFLGCAAAGEETISPLAHGRAALRVALEAKRLAAGVAAGALVGAT